MRGVIPTALLAFITYILFTGSTTPYDLATGAVVAIAVGILVGRFLVKDDAKALNPVRWLHGIIYFLWYFIVAETKSHVDVISKILGGKYEPGIVRVPIGVKTDYGKTLVANSITNTPGTVVVDMDENYYYVNWIDVKAEEPDVAKKEICEDVEKFARRIFE